MELTILRSILLGQLRPWLSRNQNNKFFTTNLTPQFLNPINGIDEYYNLLKDIYKSDRELFQDDSLTIYLKQPTLNIKQQISEPLIVLPQPTATNPIERFYYALIINEVTRVSNNILQAIIRDIKDIDRKYIVNSIKSNIVSFLSIIGDNQSVIKTQDPTSQNIMDVLQSNTVRLLLEIELLYPHYLSSIQSDKYQIFSEFLKTDIPKEEVYYIEKPLLKEISNLSTQVSKKIITQNLDIPDAFSFKFKGDTEKLKTVINQLTLKFDFIKAPTTEKHLFEVLTSKNLTNQSPQIYLDCETIVFKYFINAIKIYFNNFNPTTMEKSKLFRSKDNPEKTLKAQTIYSSKSEDYDDKKEGINSIINYMQ
jgi:hypothetical protein